MIKPFILVFLLSVPSTTDKTDSVQFLVREVWGSSSDFNTCGAEFVSYIKQSCAPAVLLDIWNGKSITPTFEENRNKICSGVLRMQKCLSEREFCNYNHVQQTTQGTEQLIPLIVACNNEGREICNLNNYRDCLEFHRTIHLVETAGSFCWKLRIMTACLDFFRDCPGIEDKLRSIFAGETIGWNGGAYHALYCGPPQPTELDYMILFNCETSPLKDCGISAHWIKRWKELNEGEHPEGSCEFCSLPEPVTCSGGQYFNHSNLRCESCPALNSVTFERNIGPYCSESIALTSDTNHIHNVEVSSHLVMIFLVAVVSVSCANNCSVAAAILTLFFTSVNNWLWMILFCLIFFVFSEGISHYLVPV